MPPAPGIINADKRHGMIRLGQDRSRTQWLHVPANPPRLAVAPNTRKRSDSRRMPPEEFCLLLENLLASPQDVLDRRLPLSSALSPTHAGRPHHRRLPGATLRPGSKPVACTGSFLGLHQEKSYVC